jgi:hypothetical protein
MIWLYFTIEPHGWTGDHFPSGMHPSKSVILKFIKLLCQNYIGGDIAEDVCENIFAILFVNTDGRVDSLPEIFRDLVKTLLMGQKPRKQRNTPSKETRNQVNVDFITKLIGGFSLNPGSPTIQ